MRTQALLFMLIAAAAAGCSEDPRIEARNAIASGDAFVANKQDKEATIEYRRAVQLDPKSGEARRKLAESLFTTKNSREGFRELVRAADLLQADPDLQVRVGGLLLATGEFEDAKSRADLAIAAEPNHVRAHLLRGSALAGLKELDAGLAEVERAIAIEPSSGVNYSSLGALQLLRGNRQEADAAFAKAVTLSPESVPARLAYAQHLMATERTTEAEAQLKAAFDLAPQDALINRTLAVYYISGGRPQLAEPHLVQLANHTDPQARFSLAQLYLATKRVDEGTALLERLAKEDATFEAATLLLARVAYARNERTAGHARVQQVLDRFPGNPRALFVRAAFFLAENKPKEAAEAATAATVADPGYADAFSVLGAARRAMRQFEEARAAYTEVLTLRPTDVDAQLALSQLNLAAGRVNEARQLAERAAENAPEAPQARGAIARAALASGDLTRADREITALMREYPKSADVHNLHGLLSIARKDMAAAERSFTTAAKIRPASLDAAKGLMAIDLAAGRKESARRRADSITAESSPTVDGLMLAANTYLVFLNDAARGEEVLRRAVQMDPARIEPYARLGQLYLQQRRIDQALREFQALADRQPKSVGIHTIVATLLHQLNRRGEAKTAYRKVLALDGTAPVAANNLAWMMMEDNENLDEAVQLAQTAKGRLPNSGDVADTLGWLYFKKGLKAQAIDELKAAVGADAANATYQYHLGLVYADGGYFDLAQKTLQDALKRNPNAPEAAEARKVLARVGTP